MRKGEVDAKIAPVSNMAPHIGYGSQLFRNAQQRDEAARFAVPRNLPDRGRKGEASLAYASSYDPLAAALHDAGVAIIFETR